MSSFRYIISSLDWVTIVVAAAISLYGITVLYSASYDPEVAGASPLVWRQVTYFSAGLVIMLITASLPVRFWFNYAYVFYGVLVALLIAVMLFGTVVNGSKRWLELGAFNLQPSELMKVGIVLGMGRFLYKLPPKNRVYGLLELIPLTLMIFVPGILILVQPDLGTALVAMIIGFGMILFVGVKRWILIFAFCLALAIGIVAWTSFLHPYQKQRIETLFNPEADPQGAGWQIIQSKIAVGSGELFGKGYLKGSQTQLEFIPERTTDFIFCVLAEEWGFLGSMLLLGLYFLLLARIIYNVTKSKDFFGAIVAVGVSILLFLHAFVNLGMVIGFLPVVGLPLPMFSYGGSSMLTMFFSLGLVLGLTSSRSVFVVR